MRMYARKTVSAEFTTEELELMIDASVNDNRVEEAALLLKAKFGDEDPYTGEGGYMSGTEIGFYACQYDEKYNHCCFEDINW